MPLADIGEASLDYLDEGDGFPILLIHGFASRKEINWVNTGWIRTLVQEGYRVIAFDNRGHGQSTRFHEIDRYSLPVMADDALGLLDHLGIDQAHVMGYSMGARITSRLAIDHGDRLERIVMAGNGYGMIDGGGDWDVVREALLAEDPASVTDARGIAFRSFADSTGSDRIALAACVTGVRETFSEAEFGLIRNPALVTIGTDDDVAGSGEKLAELIPNGVFMPIPGRDHMKAVGDRVYKQNVVSFLAAA
ncbi:MAG: alpha/beta hydrolase [Nitratireductor sp.]|nr:alpha/beta hydrolase [Nitratireductor sp.]MCC0019710.1 alpha/beta hydrolase [Nitratireductor sp.]